MTSLGSRWSWSWDRVPRTLRVLQVACVCRFFVDFLGGLISSVMMEGLRSHDEGALRLGTLYGPVDRALSIGCLLLIGYGASLLFPLALFQSAPSIVWVAFAFRQLTALFALGLLVWMFEGVRRESAVRG